MVPDAFCFPPGAMAPAATRVSAALYAAPAAAGLLPYTTALDALIRDYPPPAHQRWRPRGLGVTRAWPMRRLAATFRYPRWAGDVLVVGECRRAAEVAMMARLVEAIVRSGRTVLYVSGNRGEHAAMRARHRAAGWSAACALACVPTAEYDRRQYWLHRDAPWQARRDWRQLEPLLAAQGAYLHRDADWALRETATGKVQWRLLAPRLRFDAAVVRATSPPLSAAILADCFASGRLSVSLQHSVVTCPSSFAPLLARRYLCYGTHSRALLAELDAQLAAASQRPPTGCEIIPCGPFHDPVPGVRPSRESASLVIIDQTSAWAPRYYGGAAQFDALQQIVPRLAASSAVRRVVVRLHPSGGQPRAWDEVAARHPDRVVLSRDRLLEADLQGASAVVGLFSTVLPAATAAAIPTFFLWQPGWYHTPDLQPFAATQFASPDDVVPRVEALLCDETRFASECASSRAAAAAYYAGGGVGDFDAEMAQILRPLSDRPRTA
ncbi:MAG: hypothetical protein SF182_23920 [Deltaproteobacteria bacterium]|nr:hypothetical protein [Deltaproteobacteria bacterium]